MREEHFSNMDTRHSGVQQTHSGGWALGVVLILIGALFILRDFSAVSLHNWWALFIMIPALGAFGRAWSTYRVSGRIDSDVRGSLIGGGFLMAITLYFLLELNWVLFWPAVLIVIGLSMLVNALLPD